MSTAKLYYYPGHPEGYNKEFLDLLGEIRGNGKCLKSEWQGDMYVSEYELDGNRYIYEEDMEYGIPYSITRITKEAK